MRDNSAYAMVHMTQWQQAAQRAVTESLSATVIMMMLGSSNLAAQKTSLPSDSFLATRVSLAGIVRDTSGRLLAGAEVRSGETFAITNDSGRFVLSGLAPDTVELTVRRLGFQPIERTFVVKPGIRVDLAIRLTPSAVRLGEIVVEGMRMDSRLWTTGFYDRQKLGLGTFFSPDHMEHHGGTLRSLLMEVSGVTIEQDAQMRGQPMARFGGSTCRMKVFVDGQRIAWAGDAGIDNIVAKNDLLAVEVYPRAALVPQALIRRNPDGGGAAPGVVTMTASVDGDCGIIALWRKPI